MTWRDVVSSNCWSSVADVVCPVVALLLLLLLLLVVVMVVLVSMVMLSTLLLISPVALALTVLVR